MSRWSRMHDSYLTPTPQPAHGDEGISDKMIEQCCAEGVATWGQLTDSEKRCWRQYTYEIQADDLPEIMRGAIASLLKQLKDKKDEEGEQ